MPSQYSKSMQPSVVKPPPKIDGAVVIEWAWSGVQAFGVIPVVGTPENIEIFGLAICRYSDTGSIYMFRCNKVWETEQDSLYDSIEDAKNLLPEQYRRVEIVWRVGGSDI